MKYPIRFFITVLLFTSSLTFYGQIKQVETQQWTTIGEVKPMGNFIINCEVSEDKKEYRFLYKDWKFEQIMEVKSFYFTDSDNAFDNFYDMIMNGLNEIPKEDIVLDLPDAILRLTFQNNMGQKQVTIYHTDKKTGIAGFTRALNKNNVQKLFGKK